MDRWDTSRVADAVVWILFALLGWRIVEATALASWRAGFKAGFNAAPLAARAKEQEVHS